MLFKSRSSGINLKWLKNSYVIALPVVASSSASAYYTYKHASLTSPVEYNYLARVHLANPLNTTSIHGETVSFEDDKLLGLAQSDRTRLAKYYRSYDFKNISVSVDNSPKNNNVSFFVHLRDKNEQANLNNFWLENVHLNQISIDRYGYEYDEKGEKKTETSAKLHSIVRWQDIELAKMAKEDDAKKLPSISFRFFNTDISKSEVEMLINEDTAKYKLDDSDDKDVSLDWFVWMDKSLLTIKMNYALQTYVFNQSGAQSETTIKTIIGDTNSASSSEQKQKREAAENNYRNLPDKYRKFAEDYITTFIETSASSTSSVNWAQTINNVTSKESFIKTDDLNKIYNRFKSKSKDLSLFSPHLITKVTAGANGNWKLSLNMEKVEDKDKKEEKEGEKPKKYEARDIKALTLGSGVDSEDRKKNLIHLIPDYQTNPTVNIQEIFERTSKYSVRNFVLSDSPEFISSVYSSNTNASDNEAIKLISFEHKNEFGLYSNERWIPVILAAIFLIGILAYLITAFKGPGAIMGASILASTVNVGGLFFFLGSQLSLVGIFGAFVGLFYTLFLGYYLMGFLKKIFDIEFLDSSNVWAVFKRGLVMVTDISLPVFVYSTFITFLAPAYLREFGIVLALFTLCSYLFVGIGGCLMSIGKAIGKFASLGNYFRHMDKVQDFHLSTRQKIYPYAKSGFYLAGIILFILSIIVLFTKGFNSFSFFRDNFLVIDKSSQDITSKLGDYVSMGGRDSVYLAKGLNSTEISGLNDSAIVSRTNAFSDIFSVWDLLFSLGCSFALISAYVFIRFGFKKFLILTLNTIVSCLIFLSLLLVCHIFISSSIFIAICSLFAFVIFYNIFSFGLEEDHPVAWYAPLVREIKRDMFSKILWTIFWFLAIMFLTGFSSFWMSAMYVGFAILFTHLFANFFYHLLFEKFSYIKNTYMWKSASANEQEKTSHHVFEEESLDPYDEELIEGINKRA